MNISSNVSSLQAHQSALNTTAHNVANVNSDGYIPSDTNIVEASNTSVTTSTASATDNGSANSQTDLTKELTDQIVYERGFEANVSAIQTQDQLTGTLLDIKA
jgi:flagellar hook protein FlgE